MTHPSQISHGMQANLQPLHSGFLSRLGSHLVTAVKIQLVTGFQKSETKLWNDYLRELLANCWIVEVILIADLPFKNRIPVYYCGIVMHLIRMFWVDVLCRPVYPLPSVAPSFPSASKWFVCLVCLIFCVACVTGGISLQWVSSFWIYLLVLQDPPSLGSALSGSAGGQVSEKFHMS